MKLLSLISCLGMTLGLFLLHPAPSARASSSRTVEIGGLTLTVPGDWAESVAVPTSAAFSPAAEPIETGETVVVHAGAQSGGTVLVLKAAPAEGLSTPAVARDFAATAPHEFSVGANVGLPTIIGFSAGWRFSDHFGVRSGLDTFSISRSETLSDIRYNVKLRLQSEPLMVDVYPWKKHSFRLSAGVLFNQNEIKGALTPTAPITIGGTTYAPASVGTLHLGVKQKAVSPAVTLGGNFFYFDSAHHWAFSGELGAFFAGKPEVRYSSTVNNAAVLASVEQEKKKIEDEIGNKMNIIPLVKLGITFSF